MEYEGVDLPWPGAQKDWAANGSGWSGKTWIVISENASGPHEMVSEAKRDSVVVFGCILSVWSVVLNVFLCWLIGRRLRPLSSVKYDWRTNKTFSFPAGRCPMHWFIFNFSLGQALMAAFIVPMSVATEAYAIWPAGSATCKMWLLTQVTLVSSALWNLFAIVMDRFVMVVSPGAYDGRRGNMTTVAGVVGTWTAALASAIPVGVLLQQEDFLLEEMCAISMTVHNAFVLSFIVFFIPAIMVVTALGALLITLLLVRGRSRRHNRLIHAGADSRSTTSSPLTARSLQSDNTLVSESTNPEALSPLDGDIMAIEPCLGYTRTTIIVVFVVCAGCWAPFYVTNLLIPFCDVMCVDPSLWTLFIWLGYSTAGVTPLLWLLEPRIRTTLQDAIKGKKRGYKYYGEM